MASSREGLLIQLLERGRCAQEVTGGPGQAGDMNRPGAGFDPQRLLSPHHIGIHKGECIEDVHGGRPAKGGGRVVTAHDDDGGDSPFLQSVQLYGELSLPGGVRVGRFVDVAGKEDHVDGLFERQANHELEAADKIHEARVEPGGGVDATVVLHAQMEISAMAEAHPRSVWRE